MIHYSLTVERNYFDSKRNVAWAVIKLFLDFKTDIAMCPGSSVFYRSYIDDVRFRGIMARASRHYLEAFASISGIFA